MQPEKIRTFAEMSIFERLRWRKKINISDDQNHYKHSNRRTHERERFTPEPTIAREPARFNCSEKNRIHKVLRSRIRNEPLCCVDSGFANGRVEGWEIVELRPRRNRVS
jgi:transposase